MFSPTFCAAPWTVYNTNADGSHSLCCVNNKIKYDGNHADWSRSPEMRQVKRRMLAGKPVKGCEKCYAHEAAGSHSLRMLYNARTTEYLQLRRLRDPRYSEISWFDTSISNKCNQKCRICGPYNSTAWYKDAAALADIRWAHPKLPDQAYPVDRGDTVSRIIDLMSASTAPLIVEMKGGEPLYMSENRQLLKSMIDMGLNERTQELRIITNGTQHDAELLDLLNQFPNLNIALSIDATGKLHEYVRGSNLSWEQCRKRWSVIAGLPNLKTLRISNTVYAYNIFNLGDLKHWVCSEFGQSVQTSDAMLHEPQYLHAKILPLRLRELACSTLPPDSTLRSVLNSDATQEDFGSDQPLEEKLEWLRLKFKQYTRRMDRLRNEDLSGLVPELAEMMR